MRVCSQPGCPELTTTTYCTEHTRARDRARGTRQQRGYDRAHEQRRAADLPAAYGKPCPYCQQRMWPHQALDWDHTTGGITHASCNRSEGATRGNRGRT